MPGSSSRVPLVRCPKCGHLLPELPPYSVYHCGACGAYLRAEKGSSVDDALSENSGDRIGEGSEREVNGEILGVERGRADEMPAASARTAKSVRSRYGGAVTKSPIGESNLGDSDVHSKSSGRSMDGDGHGRKAPGDPARSVRLGFKNSPMREPVLGELEEQRSMGSDAMAKYEEMESREKVGAWFDHVKEETSYANRDEWNGYDESEVNRPRRKTWSLEESPMGFGSVPRVGQVGRRADHIVDEMIEPEYDDSYVMRHRDMRSQDGYGGGFRGNNTRLPIYPDQGPSNYPSYYQPRHSPEGFVDSSSLRNVEMKQAELFRLYNDLKQQVTITGDLPGNPIRRGHHRISSADYYGGPDDYMHDEPRLRRPTASVDMDENVRMSPHYMDRSRVPPSRFVPKEFPFDDDPSWPQIPGRQPQYRRHYPGHSVDSTYDPSGLNRRREGLHHPHQPYEQAPSTVGYRRYPDSPISAASDFPGPRPPYSTPHGISSHSRSSVESKSDEGGSTKERKRRALLVNKNQLLCHPIAGAAPFVICFSCSQLLRLPKKLTAMKKTQISLQCGSCRTTLSFDLNRKKSNVSTQLEPKPDTTDVYDEPIKTSEPDLKSTHATPAGITNRESYDFDASGYTFPSTESETSMHLDNRMPYSKEAEKKPDLHPSSSNASRVDLDLGNAVNKTDASSPLMSNIPPRPPPGSSLQEHLDYSSIFSIKKSDEYETDDPDQDKGITDGDSSSRNHLKIPDWQAEVEINSNDVPKLDISRSSTEASSNMDRGGSKKIESFFAGITGRSSKELLSPPHDALNANINVFVNGQPLSHRVVRKAEKLAGPIQPGNYWYDSRAGFWGIMGDCCLGIIPPFIDEFGFPIPKDCSGGNTGICVNGRELHDRDLELLASRGFPRASNKSYVIDISGKVEDEETGDVVGSLGKLAPTVEKTKRGFGMQPPEVEED